MYTAMEPFVQNSRGILEVNQAFMQPPASDPLGFWALAARCLSHTLSVRPTADEVKAELVRMLALCGVQLAGGAAGGGTAAPAAGSG
jgi:hypothetical protein